MRGYCAFCRTRIGMPCRYCGANTCTHCHHDKRHLNICDETRRRETR